MEAGEAVIPELFVVGEPVADGGELVGEEVVAAFAAVALFGDEAGFEKDAEVLGDGGTGHAEFAGDGVDGAVGGEEEVEHATARGVADGLEDVGFVFECCDHERNICKGMLTRQVMT